MSRCVLAIALCLLAPTAAGFAQAKISVEGVWRIAEVVTPGGNPRAGGVTITTNNPQPGLIIFTQGYYSEVSIQGGQPRPPVPPAKDAQNPTDGEKIALYGQWRPFTANAGTYEIKGSMLIRRVIVAKNVDVMTREAAILEIKEEGADTLWLIPTGTRAAIEPRTKWTRLE